MMLFRARAAALAAALLAAGCGYNPAGVQAKVDPLCTGEVNADPTVRELRANSAGSQSSFALTHLEDLSNAEQDANLRCLRVRGLITGGGVERARAPTPASIF